MARILAVDDEEAVLALIDNALTACGHVVKKLTDPTLVSTLDLGTFDLIILDVMMPGLDGFELCRSIRDKTDCPILFVTAKGLEEDTVYGLSVGADDYIIKPFSIAELRARVEAHLRRERREKRSVLTAGDLNFNLSGKELVVQGEKVPLTKSEYEIAEFLARNRGQVFSREKIHEKVFGFDSESDSSAISEHIKNLRMKLKTLGLSPIETVWGIGYKWKS